ncbi:MAG: hypothetical protein JNL10_10890 [Verrucomicrobiales bacterium]|nr:hypothetical protein [Verrucomicrobiales bacterium]
MSPFLFAAGWEPLIPVAVMLGALVLTALQTAWRKSRQRTSAETHESFGRAATSGSWHRTPTPAGDLRWQRKPADSPGLPGSVPQPALPPSPWERELERMLGHSTPQPPPLLSEEPEPEYAFPNSLPPLLANVSTSDPATLDTAESPTLPLPTLAAADAQVEHAATLQERARAHLNLVDRSVEQARPQPASARETHRHRNSRSGLQRLRSVSGARQAFMAAVVFGPPRSSPRSG